jgi:hypothetical protein
VIRVRRYARSVAEKRLGTRGANGFIGYQREKSSTSIDRLQALEI